MNRILAILTAIVLVLPAGLAGAQDTRPAPPAAPGPAPAITSPALADAPAEPAPADAPPEAPPAPTLKAWP